MFRGIWAEVGVRPVFCIRPEFSDTLLAAKGFLAVPNAALFFKKMLDLREDLWYISISLNSGSLNFVFYSVCFFSCFWSPG
jgi:hypothetical protein